MANIFVFGSNLNGWHGKGAALTAKERYGAKRGVGVGIQGTSYAIPTKGHNMRSLSLSVISGYVKYFLQYTREHPEHKFYVTKIGCGLAGYRDQDIAPLFSGCGEQLTNVYFHSDWSEYIRDHNLWYQGKL